MACEYVARRHNLRIINLQTMPDSLAMRITLSSKFEPFRSPDIQSRQKVCSLR